MEETTIQFLPSAPKVQICCEFYDSFLANSMEETTIQFLPSATNSQANKSSH